MRMRPTCQDRGFSFIELLAYMAIAALLILAAIPQFNQYRQKALLSDLENDVHNASLAAEGSDGLAAIRSAVATTKLSDTGTRLAVADEGSGEYTITGTHPRASRKVIYSSSTLDDGIRSLHPGINLMLDPAANTPAPAPAPAIMRATFLSEGGGGNCQSIVLPLGGAIAAKVNWGDGITTTASANASHRYSDGAAKHEVTITGTFETFGGKGDRYNTANCLTGISEWGETGTIDISNAFANSAWLETLPTSIPSTVTNMSGLFQSSNYAGSEPSNWNTSNVTNLDYAFNAAMYNAPLNWDTSNVVTMVQTFSNAPSFNQPLNHWNVAKVTNFSGMFWWANSYNQPLDRWDTRSATNMSQMFQSNRGFAQDISGWKVANVTNSSAFAFESLLTVAQQPRFTQ